jgi:hypothetical protein
MGGSASEVYALLAIITFVRIAQKHLKDEERVAILTSVGID